MTTRIETFDQAALTCVKRGKAADSRKVAPNTYVERRGDNYALRLHATDIVTYRPDGSVMLDTGGWLTVTTKARMNDFGPDLRIGSERGIWTLARAAGVRFADGMVLRQVAGSWVADSDTEIDAANRAADAHNKVTRKRVAAYVKAFTLPFTRDDVAAGNVSTSGDCWFCLMRVTDIAGQSLGDATADTDHLDSHIEEGYYVTSLLPNALTEKGYRDAVTILYMDMDRETGALNGSMAKRALTEYLNRRLLVGVAGRNGGKTIHSDILAWYRASIA